MGDVPAEANAKLDLVEVGDRSLELRYADGQVEYQSATVKAGIAASVKFTYRPDFFKLAMTGTAQDVRTAIRSVADINARNMDGWTALMLASRDNSNPEVIAVLLKAGADLSARDSRYGWTALIWAAADNPNPEVITALLNGGADINARNMDGENALMATAANNPNPQVIMILLRAGADAKAKDSAGRTAFDYAQGNEKLKGSAAYLKIKEASFAQATRHFLYITNNGSNNVSAYMINPSTGALTAVTGSLFPVGTSPIGIAVHPTGKYLYVANTYSDSVSAFTINPITGALKELSGSPFAGAAGPEGIAIDPTGKFLYAANNNSATWDQDRKEWISGSAINSITGAIALASFTAAGIRPRGIVVDPKGRFLCVANSSSDNVSVFTINPINGALTPSGSPVAAGASPGGISVDPTGNFLYVANKSSANVSAYVVIPSTGALSEIAGSPFPAGVAPNDITIAEVTIP
jgi:DNA-binding beta-propeller fold protein YncE